MLKRFKLGQIVNVVGLRGETRVYPYTDYKERFEELSELYIEDSLYAVERVRYMGEMAIIKFRGVDNRTEAEKLKGRYLYVDRENARTLEADTYFIADLIGMEVRDEGGICLGILSDVIQNTAQDVYEVKRESGKPFYIPAVGAFVLNVDLEHRRMTVRLIEGMMDDEADRNEN